MGASDRGANGGIPMSLDHLPDTGCGTRVEEQDLHGASGSNVRVHVLSDDGVMARVRVEDCGVLARPGHVHDVRSAALNGGRR